MFLDATIKTKISNNGRYYRDLGYGPCKQGTVLEVKLEHLKSNSNLKVRCSCDSCGDLFQREYQLIRRNTNPKHLCHGCNRKYVGSINGSVEHAKKLSIQQIGSNHPRWNPNKPEFQAYSNKIHTLTDRVYRDNKSTINPNDYPRTLCGVEDGWQLDHIVSIKEGFEREIDPEVIANVTNLQMLPWQENRTKHCKFS